MDSKKFIVSLENGWININTLSPNNNYFYRITKPIELNKSASGCHISFFTIDGTLLYNRNLNFFAHELHSSEEIKILRNKLRSGAIDLPTEENLQLAKWSIEGNLIYILEYSQTYRSYESVILNLKEKYCYRFPEDNSDVEFSFTDLIDIQFSEKDVQERVKTIGIEKSCLIAEKFPPRNFLGLKIHKWYPKV
jgi:hypothetical protein